MNNKQEIKNNQELHDGLIDKVAGGEDIKAEDHSCMTKMLCRDCGFGCDWSGNYFLKVYECPYCGGRFYGWKYVPRY